jgi:hypothetical protein
MITPYKIPQVAVQITITTNESSAIGIEKVSAKPMPLSNPKMDTKMNKAKGKVRHQATKINFFRFITWLRVLIIKFYIRLGKADIS